MKRITILASLVGAFILTACAGNTSNGNNAATAEVAAPAKALAYKVDIAKK